jgi:hypothetical protein
MADELTQVQITCRQCKYRFLVEVLREDWHVEAQCPGCDGWGDFTVADTQEASRPDPQELGAASQKLGEQLWQPLEEHRGHPAVAWMDRVGNGLFEDDYTKPCGPAPWLVYRFTRQAKAAYVWQQESSWFVRGWHARHGRRKPPEPVEVLSFKAALDVLAGEG